MISDLEQNYLTLLMGGYPLCSRHEKSMPPAAIAANGNSTARTVFMGAPVYTNAYMPAYKARVALSDKVSVSREFRESFNEWLREYFGQEPYLLVAEIPGAFDSREAGRGDTAIFCHPDVEKEVRAFI